MPEAPHRAGVVALLGRPNAGKSSLLNRLLGEKLAIVSDRPQTTRSRLLGILTLPGVQLLLVDTPGLHAGAKPLDVAMRRSVEEVASDCDVALMVADVSRGFGPEHAALAARVEARGGRVLWVATRADRPHPLPSPAPGRSDALHAVSARTGEGVDALLREITACLPESPPLHPADALSDRSLRFLAAECVREAGFRLLAQELPYALAVEVESFDERRADLVGIRANLLVERPSQKAIAIGRGGRMIAQIGARGRRDIETLLRRKVHLELFVKVERGWSRDAKRLKTLGYF